MARTGAPPRRGARPTPSRPRTPAASRSRSTGSRASVGVKRTGPSLLDNFFAWLTRTETVGVGIVLVAFFATLTLGGNSSPLDGLVKALGLHVFTLAFILAGIGVGIWQRQISIVMQYPRLLVAAIPLFLVTAGFLGLATPDVRLGSWNLINVTAGGTLGHFFFASVFGALCWLALCVLTFCILWPGGARATIERTPGALETVWSWQIPQKTFAWLATIVDFAFPTRPPEDDEAQRTPPAWLPPEQDDDEDLLDPDPVPAMTKTTAPEIPDERLRQGNLPMNWLPPPQNIDAPDDEEDLPAQSTNETPWALPPIDMLIGQAPVDETTSRPDNAMRAALIVETLASFGVDARVSAYHEGPVVTQFDIEPGWEIKYRTVPERDKDGRPTFDKNGKPVTRQEEVSRTRVRVNEITRLSNDLALALAAPSLRIEAPVPGRSVVGIEVPNTSASVVTMRSVIESPAFQRLSARTKLALPLGKSVSGEAVVADLAKMPHLLIAGATGAGKSVAINTIISSILMQSRPEDVRFVMIDPKRVELSGFALIPHLAFSNIVVDMEKVVGTLGAVLHEMEARYKNFAALAVRNIEAYNKHPKVKEKLPFWVVIIDELADLMMAAPFEVERQICRLAQLARATGIHLIVATQRPSVDVITGLIKANFPTRIAFAMSSQVDSRTILDMAGAERLLGRGDMLYMPTDSSKPKRVQGVYVTDAEIDRIVAFWAQQRATHSTLVYDHLLEQAQHEVEQAEDNDPMYEKAKALAEEHTRISTSMLQRRLRIGYPRAARIMDRLEEEGYAGGGGAGGAPLISLDGVIEEEDSPF